MKSYSKLAKTGIAISMVWVLAGCGTNQSQSATSVHPSKVTTNRDSKNQTGGDIKSATFNFHKYLPFTPLLPSYTAGYQLSYSEVIRYLNLPQNGNAISYSASYGDGFVVTEGLSNQLHLAQISRKTDLMIDNNIHATMQKHDGGESIDFVKNNILYDVTTINGGVSLQNLKKVCASIRIPATQPPSEIHLSDDGPNSSQLSFMPLKAGQFYVPSGFELNVQGSAVNISQNIKSESFQITYRKGLSYLTVIQSKGMVPNYATNFSFRTVKINGTSVYIQSTNQSLPVAVFTRPKTGVQVAIYANIPSSEIIRVEESILPVKKSVYVFSQSLLKIMYVVEYFRMVGPINPPAAIQSDVNIWAPKVSTRMIPYAPASARSLDRKLIQNIQGSLQNPPKMQLLSRLPGYTLHKDQLPSGTRIYWYPSNNQFSNWIDPVQK